VKPRRFERRGAIPRRGEALHLPGDHAGVQWIRFGEPSPESGGGRELATPLGRAG
jgi:hypothetical protein